MTTPEETPSERPTPRPGTYGEISPGVPRYGQYAPEGWVSPVAAEQAAKNDVGSPTGLPPAAAYPGFQGQPNPIKGSAVTSGSADITPAKARVLAAVRFIKLAGLLEGIGILMSIIALLTPAGRAAYTSAMEQALSSFPAAGVEMPNLNTVIIFTAIIGAIMTGCYFFIAAKIRKGSNGARITALVLTIVSSVTVIGGSPVNIVRILICIYAMVILFRAPAKDYFAPKPNQQGGLPRS